MRTTTTIARTGLATIAVGLCAAGLPSAAAAAGGGDRAQEQVGSRVAAKLRSVSRGLDRAEGYVEDGDAAKAATSLASVRRSLAAAQRTTLRRIAADGDDAAAGARAVERAEHAVVASTTSLYDGRTGDVVTAISTTLDAALDGREALLAGVGALSDEQRADYDRYYDKVAADLESESEDIADATADDELAADATAALADASTRIAAARTAVDAVVGSSTEAEDDDTLADSAPGAAVAAAAAACGPGGRGGAGGSGTATGTTGTGSGTTTGSTGAGSGTSTGTDASTGGDGQTTAASRFGGGRR